MIIGRAVTGLDVRSLLATAYAARYPVRGVVNIDQPLRVGGFAEFLRRSEPVLNSYDFVKVWTRCWDDSARTRSASPAFVSPATVVMYRAAGSCLGSHSPAAGSARPG
jgi:hypothetical protein